jgi:CRISPR/Cas system-associated exonuclease Cas4 (RecB family)
MLKRWKKGSLIYIDVNYFSPPVEHPVKADPGLHKKIKDKCKRVFKAVKDGKLPKKYTEDCGVCNYAYMCTNKKLVL